MNFYKLLIFMLFIFFFSKYTYAVNSAVVDAKITRVEFYGSQFTVHFDKSHNAVPCGHTRSVAMNSATEPGKSHMAVFLTSWASGKSITAHITDDVCSGDRPTLKNWSAK